MTQNSTGTPYDFIHVDTIGLLPHVAHAWRRRVVLNHHNVESQMLSRRADNESSRLMRAYCRRDSRKLRVMERDVCPAVGMNIVVSALDAERLRGIAPGSELSVVENGVDTAYFGNPDSGEGDPRHLVFAGSMGWYPNDDAMVHFLQDTWPLLVRADPGFRLTIVGHSPSRRLLALAADDARISVTGSVPDVRPIVAAAGVYVCPIRDGGGTRLKVLDAFAMGKPLVATALAVEGLEVEAGRHYLQANTPAQFVQSILELRDAPGIRASLGGAGRRLVEERYDWAAIGRRLDRAYEQVTSRVGK